MKESQVNVITMLISDCEPPVAVEPGESALHHPPVPAQLLTALHSFTCYAALDTSLSKKRPAPGYVIRFVSMPLVGALTRTTRLPARPPDRLDAVHHLLKDPRVVGVGTRQFHRQRDTPSFDHNMALRAGGRRTELPLSVGFGPIAEACGSPFLHPWLEQCRCQGWL